MLVFILRFAVMITSMRHNRNTHIKDRHKVLRQLSKYSDKRPCRITFT